MSDDDHAVVVGITNYPSLTPLKGPENDALAFRDWLVDERGGALPEGNVSCILSSQFDNDPEDRNRAQPTVDSVIAAFADLMDDADKTEDGRLGRRLYIFLAGHGVAPNVDDAALLAANAARSRLYHLPGAKVAASLRTAPMFDEIVLLMDCCRDHTARLPDYVLPWEDRSAPGHDSRWWYGFATKWSGKARERPMPGGKVHGLFTQVLLDGLREGHTSTGRLESFVKARLPQVAGPDEYHEPDFSGNDDIILAEGEGPPSVKLRISFGRTRQGVFVDVLDGAFRMVESRAYGGEPWELEVPPGIYSVKASDRNRPKHVTLTKGTVDVKV
jgi:hypothetical protein